ncbi:fused MFS/spermidine synthase [Pseudoxanthomonas sp. UTMC 1351]|uniref:fused MFS/spermidine synthase n=1 Tax=Pseudoxanthomonas sp. UTMC 1351 TaxID=2695853 RepID=UPI0034CEB0D0
MTKAPPLRGAALLWLFVASGFAGLIYQSMWSHYLGLLLGHAAFAQSLVLSIFMGGMALGAWLVSRGLRQWRRLILLYAVAEAAIGLFGLGFHPLFSAYSSVSQEFVLPLLGEGLWGRLYPWLSATLLILPACVLLGATFPLLSVGWLRTLPAQEERVLGGLYFANSLGAAAGALVATFLLLPAFGMPGTLGFAGAANLLVAVAAWGVSRGLREEHVLGERVHGERAIEEHAIEEHSFDTTLPPTFPQEQTGNTWIRHRLPAVAFLSSAFSFVYEIGWVRLLNQVLGTTLHAFELMLAAFLLGLAFGGLWVRRRAGRVNDAVRLAGFAQIALGMAALLSLVAFANAFGWMEWLMGALSRSDSGYLLYTLGSAAIALLVMFPAAFFAGMTLPLFTVAWLRAGGGEAGIGRLYAANTLGAIAGVMLMMHVLIPLIGVRLGVLLAALGDALLGFWLLARAQQEVPPHRAGAAALVLAFVLILSLTLGRPDPREQAGGVFRSGVARLSEESQLPFLRDGKTTTVAIVRSPAHRSAAIITNGKSDAAMALDMATPPRGDELTMVMLGALPLAVHPEPRNIGVIGWGSGLTTHTLLGSPRVAKVETVEIEPAIHAAAKLFGNRVVRAYEDPRSHVHFDDARRFFATGQRRYDVIVSEPSNPWVSGTASLFTREFYAFLRTHLTDDGVLVQWLQTYEMDDALLATLLAALLAEFPNAEVYLAHDVDLVVVAYAGKRHRADYARLQHPDLQRELARVGLGNAQELALRRIGDDDVLRLLVRGLGAEAHSDFYPRVALRAPASRFRSDTSVAFQNLVDNGLPVLDMLGQRSPPAARSAISLQPEHRFTRAHRSAATLAARMRNETVDRARDEELDASLASAAETLRGLSVQRVIENVPLWTEVAYTVATATIGLLPAEDLRGLWIEPAWIENHPNQPDEVRKLLLLYGASASRDSAAMRDAGEAVLQSPGRLPVHVQEQALVIAQLGAIGMRDFEAVEALHAAHGAALPSSERLRRVRHLLRVWAAERALE